MYRSVLLIFLFLVVTLSTGGCGGLLPEPKPAQVFYRLDYDPPPVDCPRSFDKRVRLQEFFGLSPYDQVEMVVLRPGGEVRFSGAYLWVAPPGRMVAESLGRDLSAGDLFPAVAMDGAPSFPPLELSGRIHAFAWEQNDDGEERAVLKVRVSLTDTAGESRILFHRVYQFKSPPHPEGKAPLFATAMSGLVRDLSVRLQQDLCALVKSGEIGSLEEEPQVSDFLFHSANPLLKHQPSALVHKERPM